MPLRACLCLTFLAHAQQALQRAIAAARIAAAREAEARQGSAGSNGGGGSGGDDGGNDEAGTLLPPAERLSPLSSPDSDDQSARSWLAGDDEPAADMACLAPATDPANGKRKAEAGQGGDNKRARAGRG